MSGRFWKHLWLLVVFGLLGAAAHAFESSYPRFFTGQEKKDIQEALEKARQGNSFKEYHAWYAELLRKKISQATDPDAAAYATCLLSREYEYLPDRRQDALALLEGILRNRAGISQGVLKEARRCYVHKYITMAELAKSESEFRKAMKVAFRKCDEMIEQARREGQRTEYLQWQKRLLSPERLKKCFYSTEGRFLPPQERYRIREEAMKKGREKSPLDDVPIYLETDSPLPARQYCKSLELLTGVTIRFEEGGNVEIPEGLVFQDASAHEILDWMRKELLLEWALEPDGSIRIRCALRDEEIFLPERENADEFSRFQAFERSGLLAKLQWPPNGEPVRQGQAIRSRRDDKLDEKGGWVTIHDTPTGNARFRRILGTFLGMYIQRGMESRFHELTSEQAAESKSRILQILQTLQPFPQDRTPRIMREEGVLCVHGTAGFHSLLGMALPELARQPEDTRSDLSIRTYQIATSETLQNHGLAVHALFPHFVEEACYLLYSDIGQERRREMGQVPWFMREHPLLTVLDTADRLGAVDSLLGKMNLYGLEQAFHEAMEGDTDVALSLLTSVLKERSPRAHPDILAALVNQCVSAGKPRRAARLCEGFRDSDYLWDRHLSTLDNLQRHLFQMEFAEEEAIAVQRIALERVSQGEGMAFPEGSRTSLLLNRADCLDKVGRAKEAREVRKRLCRDFFPDDGCVWAARAKDPLPPFTPNKMVLVGKNVPKSVFKLLFPKSGYAVHRIPEFKAQNPLNPEILGLYGLVIVYTDSQESSDPGARDIADSLVTYVEEGGNLLVFCNAFVPDNAPNPYLSRFGLYLKQPPARGGKGVFTNHPAVRGLRVFPTYGDVEGDLDQAVILGTADSKPAVVLLKHGKGRVLVACTDYHLNWYDPYVYTYIREDFTRAENEHHKEEILKQLAVYLLSQAPGQSPTGSLKWLEEKTAEAKSKGHYPPSPAQNAPRVRLRLSFPKAPERILGLPAIEVYLTSEQIPPLASDAVAATSTLVKDGEAVLMGRFRGKYDLSLLFATGYGLQTDSWLGGYVKYKVPHPFDLDNSSGDQDLGIVEIPLTDACSLEGTVTGRDGKPAARASVDLYPLFESPFGETCRWTDEEGRYCVRGLMEGRYEVTVAGRKGPETKEIITVRGKMKRDW